MSDARQWQDLLPRVLSGLAIAALGVAVVWAGGWAFRLTACVAGGLMVWEVARMHEAPQPRADGVLAAAALLAVSWLPGLFTLPLLLAAALVGAGRAGRDTGVYVIVFAWILLATFALMLLRDMAGLAWVFWLVSVVVASDVAGYFAGRMIGGAKFWPSISPKKTWSGTVAGWILAGLVGLIFSGATGAGLALLPLSVVVAFAGQMGDIAQSAVKRRAGVKDSSALIPGHGGVFDRFDALLGASAATLLLWMFGLLAGAG